MLTFSLSRENWSTFWRTVSQLLVKRDSSLQIDSKPFVEQLFSTLQTKSFLSSAAQAAPATAPVIPAQPPAINPNPPPNAPTGPSAMLPSRPHDAMPTAGPSGRRDAGDVDMDGRQADGSGNANGDGNQRKRCFDYHRELPAMVHLAPS